MLSTEDDNVSPSSNITQIVVCVLKLLIIFDE